MRLGYFIKGNLKTGEKIVEGSFPWNLGTGKNHFLFFRYTQTLESEWFDILEIVGWSFVGRKRNIPLGCSFTKQRGDG